ncbi:DUF4386 domain-containing protein [SCandidatus Aminicenantes bacterium Aminicenantia_JdfR_composite]|jgi:hypothetical protein|nr:DUF4386 domain-containing protein [SCandidatus Aminicenantes bacterium Aminicenantia_JdfR_composite]MCP2605913.1 DUF4386 domain-containing protein [Candidatus Aminicenantes bacterium AC-335-O07]
MENNKILGLFSFLSAIGFIITGITHFLMPPEQLHFARGITSDFFISLSKNATAFHIHYGAFIVACLLFMGIVLCARIEETNSFLFKITRIWALLGLALIALDFSRMHYNAIRIAGEFNFYGKTLKAFILQQGIDRLEPYGIAFTLVGIHIFYWNYLIIRSKFLPVSIAYIGMFGGIVLQFVFIGTLTHIGPMIDIAAGLGGVIVFPIWLISLALRYLKIS